MPTEFKPDQRVFHRQLKRYGTYLAADDLDRASSHVNFDAPDGEDVLRVTTSRLIPAEQAEESN